MFCPNCGISVEKDAQFCPNCGSGLPFQRVKSVDEPRGRGQMASKWLAFAVGFLAVAILAAALVIWNPWDNDSPADVSGVVIVQPMDSTPLPSQTSEPEGGHTAALAMPEPTAADTTGGADANTVLPGATPIPMMTYEWLEDQSALQTKLDNFLPKKWSEGNFYLASKTYHHGVGITMRGSRNETVFPASLENGWTESYAETYLDIPLGQMFLKMTFDIGLDNSSTKRWGPPETNGTARLLIKDVAGDRILYDTGIVNYAFTDNEVTLDLSGISILRIVYQVSPVTDKMSNSLNLVLGDALVYQYADGYEQVAAFTPTITALPTDYSQYEPYATDDIERFILRGFREKYTVQELYVFSQNEMEFVINGMYALAGKTFGEKDLWEYFTSKPWYYPVQAYVNDEMNTVVAYNLNLIVGYMKDMGWRHDN